MRTNTPAARESGTFTQSARRTQLVEHTIAALSELGYQQTTVAEVARRAGVSKGVVTYHFPAPDPAGGAAGGQLARPQSKRQCFVRERSRARLCGCDRGAAGASRCAHR